MLRTATKLRQVEKQLTAEHYAADWHIASFAQVPEKAGEVLRILHGRADLPRKFQFINQLETFLNHKPQEEAWNGLYFGGLVQRLLDVVLDRALWPRLLANDLLAVSSILCVRNKAGVNRTNM